MPPQKRAAVAGVTKTTVAGVTKKYHASQSLGRQITDELWTRFYGSSNGSVAPQSQQTLSKLFDKYRGMTDSQPRQFILTLQTM
jgi:hypothetical protein